MVKLSKQLYIVELGVRGVAWSFAQTMADFPAAWQRAHLSPFLPFGGRTQELSQLAPSR